MLATLISSRLATALTAGALAVGGLSASAFAGALPDSAQNAAHQLIGAPASHSGKTHGKGHGKSPGIGQSNESQPTGAPSSTPVGPDATGPEAYGLCNAYAHAKVHGKSVGKSVAFRNLATAAGGVANIAAYCSKVPHPGSAESDGAGKPGTVPSHPTGKPSTHPMHPRPDAP
jgi:hypothetical protein